MGCKLAIPDQCLLTPLDRRIAPKPYNPLHSFAILVGKERLRIPICCFPKKISLFSHLLPEAGTFVYGAEFYSFLSASRNSRGGAKMART